MNGSPLYGLAAEFEDARSLLQAAKGAREKGYTRMDAYSPYPIEGMEDVIKHRWRLPPVVLFGGLLGFFTAWGMEYYIAVLDYPVNVAGRPLNSWPSFIVIMFELTVLFSAIFAFFGSLGLAGYPRPHHPIFNLRRFQQASNNRFFLCIEASDPIFDREGTAEFLAGAEPLEVWEVDED